MLSEKNGKLITNVVHKGKNKVITFADGENLLISEDNYVDHYLYAGKKLLDSEYLEIVHYQSLDVYRKYLMTLLAKGSYSTKEIRIRLAEKKHASSSDIATLIKELKGKGIIDDVSYAREQVELRQEHGYANVKIKFDMYREGIAQFILDEYKLDEDDEEEKIIRVIEESYKKYVRGKSKLKLIEAIKTRLMVKYGYSYSSINAHINEYVAEFVPNDNEKLQRDFDSALVSLQNKYHGSELKDKMIKKLLSKGFEYSMIKEMIEEKIHEFEN